VGVECAVMCVACAMCVAFVYDGALIDRCVCVYVCACVCVFISIGGLCR
jgi:hypothetical protein